MIIFAIPNLSTCLLLSYSCYTGRSTYLRTFRINSSLEVSNDVLRVRYRSSIQKAMVGQAYIILGGAGSALGPSRPSDLKKRAENTAQGDDRHCKIAAIAVSTAQKPTQSRHYEKSMPHGERR